MNNVNVSLYTIGTCGSLTKTMMQLCARQLVPAASRSLPESTLIIGLIN